MNKKANKRTVYSPKATSKNYSGEVLSVILAEDEDVVWTYAYTEIGEKYVNGYSIIKKK